MFWTLTIIMHANNKFGFVCIFEIHSMTFYEDERMHNGYRCIWNAFDVKCVLLLIHVGVDAKVRRGVQQEKALPFNQTFRRESSQGCQMALTPT